MPIALDVIQLVLGIAILYWGAEWLIRGSARLARSLGVKPLVIGLIVVAFGSSAPELAVSTKTALAHSQPIALGTVIGSCVANISLILGITALISPPTIDNRVIRREIPILVGSVVVVPIFLRNGEISSFEGAALVGCAFLFTIVTLIVSSRLDPSDDDASASSTSVGGERPGTASDSDGSTSRADMSGASLGGRRRPRGSALGAFVSATFGIGLLLLGSEVFVHGGRSFAEKIAMSERMLGLTIMALGTATPELIAAIVAAARGRSSLAVSSVIGSNLLSVFLVLGITAYLEPIRLGEGMHVVDLVGLVGITLLGVFMLRGKRRISRFEGAILVAAYIGFLVAASVMP